MEGDSAMTTRARHILAALLTLTLIVAAVGLAACSPDESTDESATDTDTATEDTDADEATDESTDDSEEGEEADPEEAEEPADLTVMVYFSYGDGNAMAVERTIPYTTGVAAATMEELLAGPTEDELSILPLLHTQIPEDTELLGLTIEDDVARVDLSVEYESGGGTLSITARVAQVVYTLTQFPTVDAVEFYLEGELVEVFSGEGLMFDGPQEPEDYYDLIPIDA